MPLVTPQLGLLEDDIVYRLAMLAVNVLQPLKDVYPGVVVTSGFRQTNTGIGQHELAEAVDIQIRNQTPELLFEVADYIRKHLPFDQLILNHTNRGTQESWIHVSFSTFTNRGSVLTKDFSDRFHDGLFLVDPLSAEEEAEALRVVAAETELVLKEMQRQQERETRLNPPTRTIDDVGDTAVDIVSPDPPPGPIHCRADVDWSGYSDMDAIDLSRVEWTPRSREAVNAGVTGWSKTSKMITAEVTSSRLIADHTKAGCWGRLAVLNPATNSGGTECTVWMFVQIDGVWHGGVGEHVRPGQIEKSFGTDYTASGGNMTATYYDAREDGTLYTHVLQPGELVGMMVTTPARNGDVITQSALKERSNVVLVPYNP